LLGVSAVAAAVLLAYVAAGAFRRRAAAGPVYDRSRSDDTSSTS